VAVAAVVAMCYLLLLQSVALQKKEKAVNKSAPRQFTKKYGIFFFVD